MLVPVWGWLSTTFYAHAALWRDSCHAILWRRGSNGVAAYPPLNTCTLSLQRAVLTFTTCSSQKGQSPMQTEQAAICETRQHTLLLQKSIASYEPQPGAHSL